MARTSRTNEEPFLAWLKNKLTQKEISDCYLYCLEIEPLLKRKHWIRSSFFEVDSPDIIMLTIRLIDDQKSYSSTKKEIFRHIKDSLLLYMNFLREKSLPEANKSISNSPVNTATSPVDKDDAHPSKDWIEQEKNAFMIWQRENGQIEVNVTLYAQAVERASDLAKKLNCKHVDFYCPDPKTTEAALCELRANAKFTALNTQKNFIFTRAIKKYAEFQQNQQYKKENSDKSSKISWTKYEAAILLDGCIEIINNRSGKTEVIQRISRELRQMAINNGLEIDDIYRNTNGIQFQMMSMESAFWGKTIIKPSTALFREIVLLYQMKQDAYNALLTEARRMVSKDSTVPDFEHPPQSSYTSNNHPPVPIPVEPTLPSPVHKTSSKWEEILVDYFPDGYILDDFISQFQASGYWTEKFGESCPLEGAAIDTAIRKCGTLRDGRV